MHKEPNVPAVQAAARALEADAVFMGWYQCQDSQYYDEDTYSVDLYLVDVRTGQVRTARVGLLDTGKALRRLVAELFQARGL